MSNKTTNQQNEKLSAENKRIKKIAFRNTVMLYAMFAVSIVQTVYILTLKGE